MKSSEDFCSALEIVRFSWYRVVPEIPENKVIKRIHIMFDTIIKILIAGCAVVNSGVGIVVSFVVPTILIKSYISQALGLNIRWMCYYAFSYSISSH